MPTIDNGLLTRAYRTSAVVWAIGSLAWWATMGLYAAVGWTAGAAVSLAVVRTLEIVIRRQFVPGNPRAGSALARLSVLKVLAALAILSLVVIAGRYGYEFIIAFCVGILLAQTVIILKVLGKALSSRLSE